MLNELIEYTTNQIFKRLLRQSDQAKTRVHQMTECGSYFVSLKSKSITINLLKRIIVIKRNKETCQSTLLHCLF